LKDAGKEINITYETIFELLRREKGREELQELGDTFIADLLDYLQSKRQILISKKNELYMGEDEEPKKIEKQLENVKKIIKELYEKRERKIINMALTKSRTGTDIVDQSRLLAEERGLYDDLRMVLDKHRKGILDKIIKMNQAVPKADFKELPKKKESKQVAENGEERTTMLVRFLSPVPKFLGKELETYGPFNKEDIASLPIEIARVLVGKERAEEISGT
jgi:DNA replication factor GINS